MYTEITNIYSLFSSNKYLFRSQGFQKTVKYRFIYTMKI